MIVLIRDGEVYTPAPHGRASVLSVNGTITRVGEIDSARVTELGTSLGLDVETLDASGCAVVPGLIDPHVHLIGGSGEKGYATATPEIFLPELIAAGVTTVVGCLGVDTTMKTMPALAGKVKALREEGISAFMYTGGYDVPPVSLTGSARRDILFVTEAIGAGETAIADVRGSQPSAHDLARLVSDAYVGGLLSGKAGVTHFHVGDGPTRLQIIRTLLEEHDIDPRSVYPTHVERSPELLAEAALLSHRGVTVDVDTVADDLLESLEGFAASGGYFEHLTISSDASITPPVQRLHELLECATRAEWPLHRLLPLVTTNPARILKLSRKGGIAPGMDADVLVLSADLLHARHLVAQGSVLMCEGAITRQARSLQESRRRIRIDAET